MEKKEDGVLMKKIKLHIINGKRESNWRKIGLIVLSSVLLLGISGCTGGSRIEHMARKAKAYDEQSDAMMESIVDALEEQDAEALKELFSPYALEESENLDEKIEELMEFYPGSEGGFEGNCISSRGANYGEIILILRGTYKVIGDNQEYQVRFVVSPQNDEEPEKTGLHLIQVMTEEAKPEGFKWRNEEDEPGIYVLE